MPTQFTPPPDTRSVGSGNPPADMDAVVDELAAMGGNANVLDANYAGGADPTGAADSTAAFTAAQAALGSSPGQLTVPPGTYLLGTSADIPAFGRRQGITGTSSGAVTFSYVGNGTCIAAYDSSFGGLSVGGTFTGFTIAGAGAGSAAIGMSWGNLQAGRCRDITISGFGGATAAGLQMKNGAAAWSEDSEWTAIKLINNTVGVLWDSNSFDYSVYQFVILSLANQDGMRLQNNVNLTGCRLEVRGNFTTGGTNTGAVIAIDRGNSSGTSRITGCQIYVNVECDGATGTGHYTLYMNGGTSSQFTGTGVLSFNNETISFQGYVNTGGAQYNFTGLLTDTVLTAGKTAQLTRSGIFGDGSDGVAVFDGAATVVGLVPSSSIYTMTRDILCTSITINTGVTLKTQGFRIFCAGPVIGLGTGTISNNGANAAAGAGGTGTNSGMTRGGTNGGAGGTGVSGAGGTATALTSPGAGQGGNGGAGTSGAAGSGGAVTSAGPTYIYRTTPGAVTAQFAGASFIYAGATGGGGGGSDASSNAGGGGGAGAGMIMILAWSVNIAGTVSATGGNGANGTGGNAGGGGGGGGGQILAYTLAPWTAGTTAVTGGTHGNGVGTGAAGVNGGNGTVLNVIVQ